MFVNTDTLQVAIRGLVVIDLCLSSKRYTLRGGYAVAAQ